MDKLTELYYELTLEELAKIEAIEDIEDMDGHEGVSYEELVHEAYEYVTGRAETEKS